MQWFWGFPEGGADGHGFASGDCKCGFDEGSGEAGLPGAGLGEVGFEAVAEGHQFIDFGDDAVLFGERRKWQGKSPNHP